MVAQELERMEFELARKRKLISHARTMLVQWQKLTATKADVQLDIPDVVAVKSSTPLVDPDDL
jgi:hypothetical protein